MEEDEKLPKDNKEQRHKPKTDGGSQSTSHEYQDESDKNVLQFSSIEKKNDQETEHPKVTISIIIEKKENLGTTASSEKLMKLELSRINSQTSGMMQALSTEISNLPDAVQHDTLKAHISVIQTDDDSAKKILGQVKNNLLSIVKSIEEVLQNSDESQKLSDIATNRLEISVGENTARIQSADATKLDSVPIPSTSYDIPDKEKLDSSEEVLFTSCSVFTPDTGTDAPPCRDSYNVQVVEEKDTTPMNRDIELVGKKILMQSSESKSTKRYFFRARREIEQEDLIPLITNVRPKHKSLNDSCESEISVDNSQNSEHISERSYSDWTDENNTIASQSTQLEEYDVDEDLDRTRSSAYQSAVYNLDNTNLFESVSLINLNAEQEFKDLQVNIGTASDNDNSLKSENTQTEMKNINQDTSQLDSSDSTTLLYNPNLTYPFHQDVGEYPFPKPILFDRPNNKVQEKDLPKEESDLTEYYSEIDETINSLQSLNKKEHKPDENKAEVLLPKTSTYEDKPDENKAEVLLPGTSTYEGESNENKAVVSLPKIPTYEDKPDENKAEVLLPKTPNSDTQNESVLDQKLLMQFPIDWSTLSDFNIETSETRNIVHSTPLKEISIKEISQEKLSTHPEHSKADKSKSSPNVQQEQKTEKEKPKSKNSSSSVEELPSEDTKFIMNKTGAQVDWVWLPANKLDFFLPSTCCYQILPGEDTHSDSSSRVDGSEKEIFGSDNDTLKTLKNISKEVLYMASGDALTEHKTFNPPEIELNTTFDRPSPQLNETFVREGPEFHKEVGEIESELNKTFDKPLSDFNKPFDRPVPEFNMGPSSPDMNVTFVKPEPAKLESISAKEYKNKGWDINEECSSFFTLNPVIHGFYDLFEIPKFSPRSLKLSTIYEVSESDSSTSIPLLHFDAAQQSKIRDFAESLIEARKNQNLYYDMGSVMTCVSDNPFATIDEFFVLGKYILFLDEGSDSTGSTIKPEIDDFAHSLRRRSKNENNDSLKFVCSSTSNLEIIKEEILVDTDLEMFCKQELGKFPKDSMGIRFKQLIKFNGKVLFDCRCNYDELPLKLRRKYEEQEYMLLEFNHLIIPKQRKVYFSLHCCRHTIEEMIQILCITEKTKYIDPTYVEEIVCSYRCAYVKSQLTHTPETLSCPIMQPKFFKSMDDNSKNKFVQDWLNTSRAVAQKQLEQSSTTSPRTPGQYTEYLENQGESFINLMELEESVNTSTMQLTPHHDYFDEQEEDDPEES